MFGNKREKRIIIRGINSFIIVFLVATLCGCHTTDVSENDNPIIEKNEEDKNHDEEEISNSTHNKEEATINLKEYTRKQIDDLFHDVPEKTLPQGVSFLPTLGMQNDNLIFGRIIEYHEEGYPLSGKTQAFLDMDTGEIEIIYKSQKQEDTQISEVAICDAYFIFSEVPVEGLGDMDTYLYDIKNNILTELKTIENVPYIARASAVFGENGFVVTYREDDKYKTYYYDYKTLTEQFIDERVIVAGYKDGYFFGGVFSNYVEEEVWKCFEDTKKIVKEEIGEFEGYIINYVGRDELLIHTSSESGIHNYLYFYDLDNKNNKLLLKRYIGNPYTFGGWLKWFGESRPSGKPEEYLINLKTKEYYQTYDWLYLSESGIVRFKKINEEKGNIPNDSNWIYQFIRF